MKLRKIKQDSLRFIGNYSIYIFATVLCKSLRIAYKNKEAIDELNKKRTNYVLAFWHGNMLLAWYLNRKQNFVALTSKSKDGDLLAKLLKKWDYSVVRGSSTEGGDVALGILVDFAKNKRKIAITPDGPKGPRYKLKAGAVITAKKSGIPLILMGVGFKKKKILKSWDKFEVPAFMTEAKAVYSDPVYVDKNLSYEETSVVIKETENKLLELQNESNVF